MDKYAWPQLVFGPRPNNVLMQSGFASTLMVPPSKSMPYSVLIVPLAINRPVGRSRVPYDTSLSMVTVTNLCILLFGFSSPQKQLYVDIERSELGNIKW